MNIIIYDHSRINCLNIKIPGLINGLKENNFTVMKLSTETYHFLESASVDKLFIFLFNGHKFNFDPYLKFTKNNYCFIDDIVGYHLKFTTFGKFKKIFTPNPVELSKKILKVENIIQLNNFASYRYDKINNDPINKICLSGNLSRSIYIERYRLNRMAKKILKNKVDVLTHPSYTTKKKKNSYIHKSYTDHLRNYICCFTSVGRRSGVPILVSKIFEICATGSLLLLDSSARNEMKLLGLEPQKHYIEYIYTADDIINKINWILDPQNRIMIDNIRDTGMKHVLKYHMCSNRIEGLLNNI